MSAPISKALDEVRARIPKEILDDVFVTPNKQWRYKPTSLEEAILIEVIRPRVLVDCGLQSGQEINICLSGLPFIKPDELTYVYTVPKTLTEGRTITSVLAMTYNNPAALSVSALGTYSGQGQTMHLASAAMMAHSPIPMVSNARIRILGENVLAVTDEYTVFTDRYLRCIVSYDDNMSGIPAGAVPYFADLAVLAVKAYIYNKLIIGIDIAKLYGGQDIGRYKDIVESYADADELYRTTLEEKWAKVGNMSDKVFMNRLFRLMIGGNR